MLFRGGRLFSSRIHSPELNPIENLWHYLKSHFWSNRAYADDEELEQAAIDAWHKAVLDADLMQTVCAAPPQISLPQIRTLISPRALH